MPITRGNRSIAVAIAHNAGESPHLCRLWREVPYGCAPHECYGLYGPMYDAMDDYAEMTKKDTMAGVGRYLDEYHYGPPSWDAYLQKLGVARLIDASRRGGSIHND